MNPPEVFRGCGDDHVRGRGGDDRGRGHGGGRGYGYEYLAKPLLH